MDPVSIALFVVSMLAAAGVTWLVARHVNLARHLDYEVVDIRRLLPRTGFQHRGEIEVLHEGESVAAPYLVLIRIRNTGAGGIGKEDFQGDPIRIRLVPRKTPKDSELSSRILSVELSDTNIPTDFEWEWTDEEIEVEPLLLNSSWFFELQLLVASRPKTFSVQATIRDVKEIRNVADLRKRRLRLLTTGYFIAGLIMIVIGTVSAFSDPPPSDFEFGRSFWSGVMLGFGSVSLVASRVVARTTSRTGDPKSRSSDNDGWQAS